MVQPPYSSRRWADGVKVKILELTTLIEVKEKTARDKDNYMLEMLRAMRDLHTFLAREKRGYSS